MDRTIHSGLEKMIFFFPRGSKPNFPVFCIQEHGTNRPFPSEFQIYPQPAFEITTCPIVRDNQCDCRTSDNVSSVVRRTTIIQHTQISLCNTTIDHKAYHYQNSIAMEIISDIKSVNLIV